MGVSIAEYLSLLECMAPVLTQCEPRSWLTASFWANRFNTAKIYKFELECGLILEEHS